MSHQRSIPALIFMLFGMLLLPLSSSQAEIRDPGEHFFQQTLGDFSEELELAREEDKRAVLVMFEMDDCPFCYRMKTTILNQSEVQDYFRKHFMIFSVDIEGDIEINDFHGRLMKEKEFAFRYNRVRATPVFAFFDLDGKPIARYTGATSDQAEFMLLGRYVADGHFRSSSFTRYKREQSKAESDDG